MMGCIYGGWYVGLYDGVYLWWVVCRASMTGCIYGGWYVGLYDGVYLWWVVCRPL